MNWQFYSEVEGEAKRRRDGEREEGEAKRRRDGERERKERQRGVEMEREKIQIVHITITAQ